MRKKRRVKPPSGDSKIKDPFFDDDGDKNKPAKVDAGDKTDMERSFEKVGVFLKANWAMALGLFIAFLLFSIGNWITVSLAIILVAISLASRIYGKEQATDFARKNWILLLLISFLMLIILPVVGPASIAYWEELKRTPWQRKASPPMTCYFYIVDPMKFPKGDQAALAKWNPGVKENDTIRDAIMAGSFVNGMHVAGVARFGETATGELRCKNLVIFQSLSGKITKSDAQPDALPEGEKPPKKDKKDEEPEVVYEAKLIVYFFVIAEEMEETEKSEGLDAGVDAGTPKTQPVDTYAPANLEISFEFFKHGFEKAKGKPVTIQHIPNFIEEKKKEAEKNQPPPSEEGSEL